MKQAIYTILLAVAIDVVLFAIIALIMKGACL